MRYALISDIHGNYPALKAVLTDAGRRGVQMYLFLGDYVEDLPWPNEVVETIREVYPAIVIRGNKEDYLCNIHKQTKSERIYEQMAVMYWNYETLKSENLNYLMELPQEAEIIDDEGRKILLSHTSPYFYRKPKIDIFHSSEFYKSMKKAEFTHGDFLRRIREQIHKSPELKADLKKVSGDVITFGHNHLQWHTFYNDVLYVDPGSCGAPLDFNTDAPYTLLEFANGTWNVEEIRVGYGLTDTVNKLRSSELYSYAPVWSEVFADSLLHAEERIAFFHMYVMDLARQSGQSDWPVSNDIWRRAAESWPGVQAPPLA